MISIDYAVMEKADNGVALGAGSYWSDLGSWRSVRTVLTEDDTPIGVLCVDNVAVVKSENGILAC